MGKLCFRFLNILLCSLVMIFNKRRIKIKYRHTKLLTFCRDSSVILYLSKRHSPALCHESVPSMLFGKKLFHFLRDFFNPATMIFDRLLGIDIIGIHHVPDKETISGQYKFTLGIARKRLTAHFPILFPLLENGPEVLYALNTKRIRHHRHYKVIRTQKDNPVQE